MINWRTIGYLTDNRYVTLGTIQATFYDDKWKFRLLDHEGIQLGVRGSLVGIKTLAHNELPAGTINSHLAD